MENSRVATARAAARRLQHEQTAIAAAGTAPQGSGTTLRDTRARDWLSDHHRYATESEPA